VIREAGEATQTSLNSSKRRGVLRFLRVRNNATRIHGDARCCNYIAAAAAAAAAAASAAANSPKLMRIAGVSRGDRKKRFDHANFSEAT